MDYAAASPLDALIKQARTANGEGSSSGRSSPNAARPPMPGAPRGSQAEIQQKPVKATSFVVNRPNRPTPRAEIPPPGSVNFQMFLPSGSEPASPYSSLSTPSLPQDDSRTPQVGETTSFFPDLHRLSSNLDLSEVRSLAGEPGYLDDDASSVYSSTSRTTYSSNNSRLGAYKGRIAPPPPPVPPINRSTSALADPNKTPTTDTFPHTGWTQPNASGSYLAVPRPPHPACSGTAPSPLSTSAPSNLSQGSLTSAQPMSPSELGEHYLSVGIAAHQRSKAKGDLAESALYFKKAMDAGSLGGKIMYGLALRHGWGVAADEAAGFKCLNSACLAIVNHPNPVQALSLRSDKKLSHELVLAIYEVGICFANGWGVPKDGKKAASYFKIAAEIGDKDSQEQLGHLYANGKHGLKKDLNEAAKWYRAAVAQGASSIGLSWIYKEKYMGAS